MPSGPAALSDGKCFSISLTSSLVGVLLSSGSGICESDGWGESSVCVTQSASDSSQGERGRKKEEKRKEKTFYSNMGFPFMSPSVHIRLSAEILVRICEGSCGEAEESSPL